MNRRNLFSVPNSSTIPFTIRKALNADEQRRKLELRNNDLLEKFLGVSNTIRIPAPLRQLI